MILHWHDIVLTCYYIKSFSSTCVCSQHFHQNSNRKPRLSVQNWAEFFRPSVLTLLGRVSLFSVDVSLQENLSKEPSDFTKLPPRFVFKLPNTYPFCAYCQPFGQKYTGCSQPLAIFLICPGSKRSFQSHSQEIVLKLQQILSEVPDARRIF